MMANVAGLISYNLGFYSTSLGWPSTVIIESLLVIRNKVFYTKKVLSRLYYGEETGPIGYIITISMLLKFIKKDNLSLMFSQRVAGEGTKSGFIKDYKLLFRKGTLFHALLLEFVLVLKILKRMVSLMFLYAKKRRSP